MVVVPSVFIVFLGDVIETSLWSERDDVLLQQDLNRWVDLATRTP